MPSRFIGIRTFALLVTLAAVAACDSEPMGPESSALAPNAIARSSHGGSAVFQYTISWQENGSTVSQVVTPIETAETVVQFYDYGTRPASANTGYEAIDVGGLLLHRNPNTGAVGFVVLYDEQGDPDGGQATAQLSGIPGTTTFVVRDDGGEGPPAGQLTNPFTNRWVPSLMDGWAIQGGFETPFSFTVAFTNVTGLDRFEWVDGSGTRTAIPLASATSITISGDSVILDDTPPTITPNLSGTLGDNGWYTGDVDVRWTVTDEQSAVTSTNGCADVTVDSDTDGVTFTCTATSGGGMASASVTVKRDATDPVVAFAGNGGSYALDDDVAITCDATDATSGIASDSCADVSGPAWTFGAGTTTLSASATDNAGNQGSASASFQVTATADGICGLVEDWVPNRGVANALCVKLEQSQRSAQRGRGSARDGQLGAFLRQVEAVRGKWLTDAQADLLLGFAASL